MVIDEVNGVVDITYEYHIRQIKNRDAARLIGHTDLKTSLQFLAEKYMNTILNKGSHSVTIS